MAQLETLGWFLSRLLNRRNLSNRELARQAGVSEGAIRNLLGYGADPKSKDPDPRTLRSVAEVLGVDPSILFRLVDYIPPRQPITVRGEYFASLFEKLPMKKQIAVLTVVESLVETEEEKHNIREMREQPLSPLAGIDAAYPGLLRLVANEIIKSGKLSGVPWPEHLAIEDIPPDTFVVHELSKYPKNIQQKIGALIRHKFMLDYDPSMVDEEWRD